MVISAAGKIYIVHVYLCACGHLFLQDFVLKGYLNADKFK